MDTDLDFLRETLQLAAIRRGQTGQNPSVGALVVKDGAILSRGYHWASGHPHAEVEALRSLGDEARGATMYVSLEPCCFMGKTPPCTELLIQRGISRVVYAYGDPNPKVAGKGKQILLQAGIEVRHVSLAEANSFYESYRYWTEHQRPFVIAKMALSLDGKIAARDGSPIRLTGEDTLRFTHEGRKRAHAILTTAKTVSADNPQLNVRLTDETVSKTVFVLDFRLETPLASKIFQTSRVTLFHGPGAFSKFGDSAQLKEIPSRSDNRFCLASVLGEIGTAGNHELWVEAGGTLFAGLLGEGLVQRAYLCIAPKFIGAGGMDLFPGNIAILTPKRVAWDTLGSDALCEMNWS
jgi:diaminohydroxyphosphoribosylaminopyrimidine deaminase / 5-amino-6-(5-phosphoribosylamino)uracil reductase